MNFKIKKLKFKLLKPKSLATKYLNNIKLLKKLEKKKVSKIVKNPKESSILTNKVITINNLAYKNDGQIGKEN